MKTGELIKKLRTDRGMTQDELGKLLGVNRQAVNKWENGTTETLKRSTIQRLSEIFMVSPYDLMCFESRYVIKPENDEEAIMLDLYKKSDDTTKEMVKRILKYNEEMRKHEKP